MKKVSVIGAGFSGISAACFLARDGFEVKVFEKQSEPGGRARMIREQGYEFDMGPSFYWMPDVYEKYFAAFDKEPSDYYKLTRLDPGYRVFFTDSEYLDIHADVGKNISAFEAIEAGAGEKLRKFIDQGAFNYKTGMGKMVNMPSHSLKEYINLPMIYYLVKLNLLRSLSSVVRSKFSDKRLIQLLEFPVLFLGGLPRDIPALYSLMNYSDMVMGTWYPMGGMNKIIQGMVQLAESQGVEFYYDSPVESIAISNKRIEGFTVNNNRVQTDIIVGSADYHHVEQDLLPCQARMYSEKYWDRRTLAPAALLFYLGVNKKLARLQHHNLFFDVDFDKHADEIYREAKWPDDPAIYVSCASKTDPGVTPEGHENLVVLIPVAPGLPDTDETRNKYYEILINRLEKIAGEAVADHIVYRRSYGHKDFISDYHSYKGNAYGLANTLMQTAFLKPKMKNKKVRNFYYTGQMTVPGPGVPPALISGQIAAGEILKDFKKGQ